MNNTNSATSNPNPTTPSASHGNRPARHVFTVTDRANDRSIWTRIGVGSLTLRLDALPVNGVLQVRDADEPRNNGGMP
jgi:hypothetical protein